MKPIGPAAVIALRGLWVITTRYTYGYNRGYAIAWTAGRASNKQRISMAGGCPPPSQRRRVRRPHLPRLQTPSFRFLGVRPLPSDRWDQSTADDDLRNQRESPALVIDPFFDDGYWDL